MPMTVLVHGTISDMLSPEFEGGWMEAQKRLAAYSTVSELIVVDRLGHAMAGEDPDFVATQVIEMVQRIRAQADYEQKR